MRWSKAALAGAAMLSMVAAASAQHVDDRPLGTNAQPRGEILFENRCARCHGLKGDGEGGLGPSLIGVIGKPVASRTDFIYSDALKAKGRIWAPKVLDDYLADPQAFAPGADMDIRSPDPAERAAIIEFVGTLR